jgi:hypothetical protein
MALKTDLTGLGMPPMLANILGTGVTAVIASGASRASAAAIGAGNRLAYITATNSGNGVALPTIGGDTGGNLGALLGDVYNVMNVLSATLIVYAPSTVTFVGQGSSLAGSVGVSIATNTNATFRVLTATTWGV